MSCPPGFDFSHRPLVPLAHDYAHGASEPWHQHNCAQLIHTLSGVVRVETDFGSWTVPPSRGVWLPAFTRHALQITGRVAARTLFIHPLARRPLAISGDGRYFSAGSVSIIIFSRWFFSSLAAAGQRRARNGDNLMRKSDKRRSGGH